MKTINIKRVYQNADPNDGFRVLIDKLWPRGVSKANLEYDYWAKEIAPSTELRKWYHKDTTSNWIEFESRYTDELMHSESIQQFVDKVRPYQTMTLLYAAHDIEHNHALVLKKYLDQILISQ